MTYCAYRTRPSEVGPLHRFVAKRPRSQRTYDVYRLSTAADVENRTLRVAVGPGTRIFTTYVRMYTYVRNDLISPGSCVDAA